MVSYVMNEHVDHRKLSMKEPTASPSQGVVSQHDDADVRLRVFWKPQALLFLRRSISHNIHGIVAQPPACLPWVVRFARCAVRCALASGRYVHGMGLYVHTNELENEGTNWITKSGRGIPQWLSDQTSQQFLRTGL